MKIGALTAAGAAVASLLLAAPAHADAASPDKLPEFAVQALTSTDGASTSTFSVPAGTYTDASGTARTFAAKAQWVCTGKTDSPHWSKGAASVIAKTRVSCKGPTANLPIRVESLLGRSASNNVSSLKIVAESNYVQNVPADPNGFGLKTWYVPEEGVGIHIGKGGYFRGSHSGEAAPPLVPFSIGSGASALVPVN